MVIHVQYLTRTRNGPTRKRGLTPKPTPMNRNLPGYVKKTIRRLGGARAGDPETTAPRKILWQRQLLRHETTLATPTTAPRKIDLRDKKYEMRDGVQRTRIPAGGETESHISTVISRSSQPHIRAAAPERHTLPRQQPQKYEMRDGVQRTRIPAGCETESHNSTGISSNHRCRTPVLQLLGDTHCQDSNRRNMRCEKW